MTFGPFSVSPASVAALGGTNFATFVSRLLATEVAAHGLSGSALETTYVENAGDGGIDAGLRAAGGTRWVPPGNSAWQFKAGDLEPAACKLELSGAVAAVDVLKKGGKYRLVLGKSLTSPKIARRRDALIAKATELGVSLVADSIEVLTADTLAQWVEEYPALAVNPLLGSVGRVGMTFGEWASSRQHATKWTSSDKREIEMAGLRAVVESGSAQPDVHIEGFSGLGKTRMVLEALRGQPYESLVVYAPASDQFQALVLNDLQAQGRTGIVVLDECDAKSHDIYSSVLSATTALRLITIGEPSGRSSRSPMLRIDGLDDDAMNALLRTNQPGLWPEAVRVVTEVAAGNVDYAMKASRAVIEREVTTANELVTADDVRSFIASELPDGALFLGCCALALFSRLGFDGEVASELITVAQGLDLAVGDLRTAATALDQRGLLTQQGRYRSVGPHPIALYLASRGWSQFGDSIVRDLLPLLDSDLAERLFRRATELGDPNVVRGAVSDLLGPDGPLGTWEQLQVDGHGQLLTHVAILAPSATIVHLEDLFADTSDEALLAMQSARRTLVWTLEKLAWHRESFEDSANLLLRLALNENEDYANNASGTWVDLFGTMLPGTAADPGTRVEYLTLAAHSSDPRVRTLAVRASERALDTHESITVAGELQGGALVEPRGMPKTYGDAWAYRNAAIDLLRYLADDLEQDVASAAFKALIGSIHASLEIEANRGYLAGVFSTLDASRLRLVRSEIVNLEALFDRADVSDERVPGVAQLAAALPVETDEDRLWSLGHAHAWDREEGVLLRELLEAARRIGPTASELLIEMLQEPALPAAHEIGRVLVGLANGTDRYLGRLTSDLSASAEEAAVGYLWGMVERGDDNAFDSFIDGNELPPTVALRLTARGPQTARAQERVEHLVPLMSVRDGAALLFRWLRDSDQPAMAVLVDRWRSRLETQGDYNAVVDLVALFLHRRELANDSLRAVVAGLVTERRRFPELGQQGWDWMQLAAQLLASDPEQLVLLLIDLVENDALNVYEGSEEMNLLKRAVAASNISTWRAVMDRVADGAWRVSFAVRGWMAAAVDLEVARSWVGDDAGRARVLAAAAPVGGKELPAVTRYLLEDFNGDDEVASALVGQFISGMWTGPESNRLKAQIEQVQEWTRRPGEGSGVIKWARRLLEYLRNSLKSVEQREAEDRW